MNVLPQAPRVAASSSGEHTTATSPGGVITGFHRAGEVLTQIVIAPIRRLRLPSKESRSTVGQPLGPTYKGASQQTGTTPSPPQGFSC